MKENIVLFSEEDTMFRLMETAINGEPSRHALDALRYVFGEGIEFSLDRLVSLPALVGLPTSFRSVVCDADTSL